MSPDKSGKESVEEATEETGKETEEKAEERKIKVSIDTTNLEDVIRRLKEKEEEAEKLSVDLKTAMEEKGKAEKDLEEKKEEAEEMKTKLELIAEKEFNSKKDIIMEEAKKFIKDEERLKKIEEGIKSVDDLKATSFMLETLSTAIKEGEEAHKAQVEEEEKEAAEEAKKADEEAAAEEAAEPVGKGAGGQIPLAQATGGATKREYDSHEAMIRDLRKRSHSEDPDEAAEAKAILDELFLKWGRAVRAEYEGKYKPIHIEKKDQPKISDITKRGGAARPNPRAKGRERD
jgi:hypothetical protein